MAIQGSARRFLFALVAFVYIAGLLFSSSAHAAQIAIGYLTAEGDLSTYTPVYLDSSTSGNYLTGVSNSDGKYGPSPTVDEWTGSYSDSNHLFTLNYDIHLDNDPVVTSFFSLQNSSGFTNTFTFTVNQPVSPTIPTSVGSGSTGFTLTAVNPGAQLDAPALSALYNAQINGGTVQSLFPAGSASLPVTTPPTTSKTINDSFSGQLEGSASLIGIFNNFTLTNGDLASATNIFRIDATVAPEPASITLSLLGFAGVAMMFRKRR